MTPNSTLFSLTPGQCCLPVNSLQERLAGICYLASLLQQVQLETDTTAAQTTRAMSASKVLVMLADDDSDDRELFEEVIAGISTAIEVVTVGDGLQLMNRLNEPGKALPAIIFLDLNMPGKSGKECLVEIKNNPKLKTIPVVIYSTSASHKDINETHGSGANLYVAKPNKFRDLTAIVAKVFSIDLEQLKTSPPIHQFVLSPDV